MTLQPAILRAALIAAVLALGGCGGDDTPPPPSPPSPPAPPPPTPTPPPAPVTDRIEPLDTATLRASTATKARPAAASRLPAGAPVPRVELGPLAPAKVARTGTPAAPLRIGVGRDVAATAQPADLARLLDWQVLADGARVAAVQLVADGAQAIRLGVQVDQLPAGAVLRFHGGAGTPVTERSAAELAALRQLNVEGGVRGAAARMVWGPDTEGAASTLEVELPPGASTDAVRLAVPRLSHLTQTVRQAIEARDSRDIGQAGSCNVDVMCTAYQTEGRAVAKMLYASDGDSYLCTGTLLNDTRSSQTPYFLTATHCIGDQAAASTLITYWFFRASACGASPQVDPASTSRSGGARLLSADLAEDTSLLQLNDAPPPNVVYAGSYFGGVGSGTDVVGVHQPMGDLQKASVGSIEGQAVCRYTGGVCVLATASDGNMFKVGWREGTTEGGSSGSALFMQLGGTRYVIGALHGGSSSCLNPGGSDYYGRYERVFPGIRSWLAP